MKKIITITTLMLILLLSAKIGCSYADFGEEDVHLIIKGSATEFNPPPTIVNDRTMLPLRFVSERLNFKVSWNEKTKAVTLKKGDKEISLVIGKNEVKVSNPDKTITLDAAPFIKSDRTFVPLRFISEEFGEEVAWDGVNRTVIIGDYHEENNENEKRKTYASEKYHFTLEIPESVYDKLTIIEEDKGVYFYVKSIYDKSKNGTEGFTGRLFSISKYDNPMTLYHGGMAINLLYQDGYYNALFASDVNFSPEDKAEYDELWKKSLEFLRSFRLKADKDSQASGHKVLEFDGKTAMLREDIILKEPYGIIVNSDGDIIRRDMKESNNISLKKNDMVILIEEEN